MRNSVIGLIIALIIVALAVALFSPHTQSPLSTQPPEGWALSTPDAQGMQFAYPISLGTSYISTSTEGWPPTAAIVSGTLSCAATDKRMIGDRAYCITRESEGAAGSTFTTFTYATMQGTSVASTTFTLRFPQCMNYDDPQQSACTIEESSYDIDGLADRIISSIRKAE
jgi:hypothetical protein